MKNHSNFNATPFWVIFGVICLITLAITCADDARAERIWTSWDGTEGVVTYSGNVKCWMASAYFAYPFNSGNEYEGIALFPIASDSTIVVGTGLNLDSIGLHRVIIKQYTEYGSPAVYTLDTVLWLHSSLGTRFTTVTGAGTLCNVNGVIYSADNNALVGAIVTATRTKRGVGVDTTTSPSSIIVGGDVTVTTDTLGLFQLYLRTTHNYADTTKGFYDIIVSYGGAEIFRLDKFYVPDVGSVDIGDTLLARGR